MGFKNRKGDISKGVANSLLPATKIYKKELPMTEKTWYSLLIFNLWLEEAGIKILQYPSS
jgi:hypothetical protein